MLHFHRAGEGRPRDGTRQGQATRTAACNRGRPQDCYAAQEWRVLGNGLQGNGTQQGNGAARPSQLAQKPFTRWSTRPLGETLIRVLTGPDRKPTLVTVVTRGLSGNCNSMNLPEGSVYLRIAKSGRTYVFYFSTDGQNWQSLRTFSLDTELPVRVGFESQSPSGPGAVAEFSSITYDPHRIGNIYK